MWKRHGNNNVLVLEEENHVAPVDLVRESVDDDSLGADDHQVVGLGVRFRKPDHDWLGAGTMLQNSEFVDLDVWLVGLAHVGESSRLYRVARDRLRKVKETVELRAGSRLVGKNDFTRFWRAKGANDPSGQFKGGLAWRCILDEGVELLQRLEHLPGRGGGRDKGVCQG